jgi:glycosyltransferase involved in cell wall biosynthesis
MLVNNPCVADGRVIRASEVAAAAGFETIVLALGSGNEPAEEERNGVLLRRLRAEAETAFVGLGLQRGKLGVFTELVRKGRLWVCQSYLEARDIRAIFEPELKRLRPQIIHAHDLATLPAGRAAARETGALLIYDSHELEAHRVTRAGIIDRWLRRRIERSHIMAADAVITVSDSIARQLAEQYGIRTPVVVMNAPDPAEPRIAMSDLRADLGLERDVPLAVYIGKITIARGLEQAVAALQYWRELHLALVGPVHVPTALSIRNLVRNLRLDERVHLVAPVPHDAVSRYVATADVSVIPTQNVCLSHYYSLPNKLLESTLARLPVAVSNFPEFRRFVECSGSGVVMNERSSRDIARAVREVYARREALRPDAECLGRVEAVYGWPRQRRVLLDLYGSLRAGSL